MSQYKIDFDSLDWDVPADGVRQKVVARETAQCRLLEFSRDFVELDWCTKGHIGYIIDGQLEIDFDGASVLYRPGDVAVIPAGIDHKHKAKSVTDKVTIFVVENA